MTCSFFVDVETFKMYPRFNELTCPVIFTQAIDFLTLIIIWMADGGPVVIPAAHWPDPLHSTHPPKPTGDDNPPSPETLTNPLSRAAKELL